MLTSGAHRVDTAKVAADLGEAILDAVAKRMRAGISQLPDGEYIFEDVMDDDGMQATDIPFKVKVTVRGEEIAFDFTGRRPGGPWLGWPAG